MANGARDMTAADDNLDERKANVLRAVVEAYIETAQPVGSGHVADAPGVGVSSATVRNDMAALENEGYLVQPHTSAGRIPTEKGYRYFVDHVASPARLPNPDVAQIRSFFAQAHGELEEMLASTSQLLADLTQYAAVVTGPAHEAATVRSVHLVGLAPRVALVVVVLANGVVDKHTIELDRDATDDELAAAGALLGRAMVGRGYPELTADALEAPGGEGGGADPAVALARTALVGLLGDHGGGGEVGEVYVGGTSRVAAAFDAVNQVSEVLRVLEQQYVVVTLLRDVVDRGLNVAIGTETGIERLADCSVVVAPYEVNGEPAGTIGLLGPTRMHYPEAIATVAVVSRRLGQSLTSG
jgi:heat-inducible transcriptional repressor